MLQGKVRNHIMWAFNCITGTASIKSNIQHCLCFFCNIEFQEPGFDMSAHLCFVSPHISLISDPCVRHRSLQKTFVKRRLSPDQTYRLHNINALFDCLGEVRPFSPIENVWNHLNFLLNVYRKLCKNLNGLSKKKRWSCATSVSTNDCKKNKKTK